KERTMDADLKAIFLAAVELPHPAKRAAFLHQACGGDARLRRRVEELLAGDDDAGSLLDRPASTLDCLRLPGGVPPRLGACNGSLGCPPSPVGVVAGPRKVAIWERSGKLAATARISRTRQGRGGAGAGCSILGGFRARSGSHRRPRIPNLFHLTM